MKHIWIICLLVVCNCNTVKEDFEANEDYEKLFPSKEIEKPANKRGAVRAIVRPQSGIGNYDDGRIKSREKILSVRTVKDEWKKAEGVVTILENVYSNGGGQCN